MENKDLAWIATVIDRLQKPLTYNERQRLTKILERVAPALLNVLDWTALSKFRMWKEGPGDEETKYAGHTCNACGQDHFIDDDNPKHRETGADRNGNGGEPCRYEELLQLLKEEQKKEE